jgi:hypothetical protein
MGCCRCRCRSRDRSTRCNTRRRSCTPCRRRRRHTQSDGSGCTQALGRRWTRTRPRSPPSPTPAGVPGRSSRRIPFSPAYEGVVARGRGALIKHRASHRAPLEIAPLRGAAPPHIGPAPGMQRRRPPPRRCRCCNILPSIGEWGRRAGGRHDPSGRGTDPLEAVHERIDRQPVPDTHPWLDDHRGSIARVRRDVAPPRRRCA